MRSIVTMMNFNSPSVNILDLPTHLPNERTPEVDVEPENKAVKEIEPKVHDVKLDSDVSYVPVFIQGTNITLQTDEDIAKWIEERKKKWPTKQNVEQRELQKEEESKKRLADSDQLGPDKKRRIICRFYQQNKSCKFGNKCKNIHESAAETVANSGPSAISNTKDNESNHYKRMINGVQVRIPKLYSKTNEVSLFKNLVKKDQYENENNLVLDFIQYLDRKGLIDHDAMKVKVATTEANDSQKLVQNAEISHTSVAKELMIDPLQPAQNTEMKNESVSGTAGNQTI